MSHTFHLYQCAACNAREIYAAPIDDLFGAPQKCLTCGGVLRKTGLRQGTLTIHPKTGKLCIEEDLNLGDDSK